MKWEHPLPPYSYRELLQCVEIVRKEQSSYACSTQPESLNASNVEVLRAQPAGHHGWSVPTVPEITLNELGHVKGSRPLCAE